MNRRLYLVFKVLILVVGLMGLTAFGRVDAGTSPGGLWDAPKPKFHHDQYNTGRSQYVGPTSEPTIAWIFEPKEHIPGLESSQVVGYPPPLLGPDGTIYYYLGGGNSDVIIVAVNPDGSLKSFYPIDFENECEYIFTPLTIGADGTFYFGTRQENTSLTCQDNTDPPRVYAVAADGSLKWRLDLPGTNTNGYMLNIAPDGTIYAYSDRMVHAIEDQGTQGAIKWSALLPQDEGVGEGMGAAIDDNGNVYVGSWQGLAAFNSNGELLWANGDFLAQRLNVPVLDPERHTLYTADRHAVYAVDAETGQLLWSVDNLPGGLTRSTSVALGPDGTVYVTKVGDYANSEPPYVCAVAPDGTLRWCQRAWEGSQQRDASAGSPVSDANGNVYVFLGNSRFVGLAPDGEVLFRFLDTSHSLDFTYCQGWNGLNELTVGACGGLYVVSSYSLAEGKLGFLAQPNTTDAALTMTVDDETPDLGGTVTFTVTVRNQGNYAATNVYVNDVLPAGLSYLSSSATQGSYDPISGVWTIGTLDAHAVVTWTVQAEVTAADPMTNTATVHMEQCDYASLNDTASVMVTPQYTPVSLGDLVWRDLDGDGIQDDGEPGINDVVVDLYQGTCNSLTPSSTPYRSTTTSSHEGQDGWYQFANLAAGDYCVVLSAENYNPGGALVGLIASPAHQGGDSTKDSDASAGLKADVHLVADDDSIDFGLHPVPPIEAGMCYVIADYGDYLGVIDHTTGHVNVIGKVVPSDGENLAIRPSNFVIYNVAGEDASTPLITIDDQDVSTTIIRSDLGLQDVDALAFDPATGDLYAVAVNPNPGVLYRIDPDTGATTHVVDLQFPSPDPLAGAVDPHIDGLTIDPATGIMYGAYSAWASKSYLVTIDPDTGTMTLVGGPADDPGYTGVDDIEDLAFHPANGTLYAVLGSEGAIGDGPRGSFEGLVILDKTTAAATPVGPYGEPLQGTEDGRWDIEAFACSVPPTGSIGDWVWNDANGNGAQDEGASYGLGGITLRLYRDDGDHLFEPAGDDALVDTQVTDANGLYTFSHLPAGTYWVDVDDTSLPTGYTLTTDNEPLLVSLDVGENYEDADFGYAGRGDISGTVFYDWDEDGQQDVGEDGIGNVEVCLYKDNGNGVYDAGDSLQACLTTNSDGTYVFNDYLPGTYFVVETQPSGLESTTPNERKVDLIVVGPSGSASDNDFGEIVRGRIGDFVWSDTNGNGVQDNDETVGIANIPLHITGVNILGQTIDITVTSSVTGYYTVEDLLPGTYTVTAPANVNGFARTSPSPRTTTLDVAHMEDLTLDFGYIVPTGISITSFEFLPGSAEVLLRWTVRSPATTPPDFRVWRSDHGTWHLLTPEGVQAKEVAGPYATYEYVDRGVRAGQEYTYRLEDGQGQFYGPWTVVLFQGNSRARIFVPFLVR